MHKTSAGRSSDPAQQALRDAKSKWNKDASNFISDVINLKKMLNGWPSKFSSEKSKIQNPLPEKMSSVLSLLSLEFKDLAQVGQEIVQKQLDYSKNRKQKKVMDASNIVAFCEQAELHSYGSNALTRLYTRLKSVSLSNSDVARRKKHRVSLLSACADIYKDILLFQEEIVKSSSDSIFVSSKLWSKIVRRWEFVDQVLKGIQDLAEKNTPSSVDEPKSQKIDDSRLDDIISDVKKFLTNFSKINSKDIVELAYKYQSSSDDLEKVNLGLEIIKGYNKLLEEANAVNGTAAKSFQELITLSKKAQTENPAARWLGKLKHTISPFDKTSASRLDIYNLCKDSLKLVDDFMNLLEKGLDVPRLGELSKNIVQNFKSVAMKLNQLEKTLSGKSFENKFVDLLDGGLLSEYNIDFDEKQKERLKRTLELRRFRELGNLYRGDVDK